MARALHGTNGLPPGWDTKEEEEETGPHSVPKSISMTSALPVAPPLTSVHCSSHCSFGGAFSWDPAQREWAPATSAKHIQGPGASGKMSSRTG